MNELNLTIFHRGNAVHYATVKACASLLWDTRFGIFGQHTDDHVPSLEFLMDDPEWEDSIESLDAPMENPTYGCVIVDFDQRLIIDGGHHSSLETMNTDWFRRSLEAAVRQKDGGLINSDTLTSLLSERRLSLISDFDEPAIPLPDELHGAMQALQTTPLVGRSIQVRFPEGWHIETHDS